MGDSSPVVRSSRAVKPSVVGAIEPVRGGAILMSCHVFLFHDPRVAAGASLPEARRVSSAFPCVVKVPMVGPFPDEGRTTGTD